jgi:hypothetical protein
MPEIPVPLQTDTITTAPGGGIRTITATVMINGIPTQVQMQVVALADPNGVLVDDHTAAHIQFATLRELREIKRLLALMAGVPVFEAEDPDNSL